MASGRWLERLALCSAALSLLPLGFSVHYTLGYARVRAGKDVEAQRATLLGVTWFKPGFVSFVDRLQRTVPPGARVLIEPTRVTTTSGRARWQLYLNHYAHPIRFYTRKSAFASGTLVDYPRWLEHHLRPTSMAERLEEEEAIAARGIDYILRLPITPRFRAEDVELLCRTERGFEPMALAAPDPKDRAADEWIEPPAGLEFDSGEAGGGP